jgi:dnd system-associated protein 4
MPSRVHRPTDKEDVLQAIIENRPFATMAAALLFAAAVGYAHDRREPFEKGQELLWEPFANAGAGPLLDMLATAVSEDKDILATDRENERVEIFEEYANGGLEVIRERLAARGGSPLDALLDLVLEFEDEHETGDDLNLEELAQRLAP